MRLDTYRCGCGKIETLPNLKAKPGPCTHKPRATLPEYGPWRPALPHVSAYLPGWQVKDRSVLKDGQSKLELRAQRGRALVSAPCVNVLRTRCQAVDAARRARAEAFFGAVRVLAARLRPEPGKFDSKRGYVWVGVPDPRPRMKKGDVVSVTVCADGPSGADAVRRAVEESLRQSSSWRWPDGYALHNAMPGDALAYADLRGVTAYAIAHKQISKGDQVYLRGPNPRA